MKKMFFYSMFIWCITVFSSSCTNKGPIKEHWDDRMEESRESLDEMGDKVVDIWDEGVDYVKDKWEETRENLEMDGDTLTHSLQEIFEDTQHNINERFD